MRYSTLGRVAVMSCLPAALVHAGEPTPARSCAVGSLDVVLRAVGGAGADWVTSYTKADRYEPIALRMFQSAGVAGAVTPPMAILARLLPPKSPDGPQNGVSILLRGFPPTHPLYWVNSDFAQLSLSVTADSGPALSIREAKFERVSDEGLATLQLLTSPVTDAGDGLVIDALVREAFLLTCGW